MFYDLVHPPHPLYTKIGSKLRFKTVPLAHNYISLYYNAIINNSIKYQIKDDNGVGVIEFVK